VLKTLVTVLLLSFGVQVRQGGTVTGSVQDSEGKPRGGIRVAAMVVRESNGGDTQSEVLESISQTDDSGRYRLELPAGRYYIVIGLVKSPTYYPGVAEGTDGAAIFSITAGSRVNGVDFVIAEVSGIVRDTAGNPIPGVRIGAMANSAVTAAASCSEQLIHRGEANESGECRLIVSPGSYRIVAVQNDRTTFYPASTDRNRATTVTIKAGSLLKGIDIVLNAGLPPGDLTRDRQLLAHAMENVRVGCLAGARLELQALIQTFPASGYVPEAKYVYADSFYLEGTPAALKDAERLFNEFVQRYPDAPRLSEAQQRLADILRR